MLKQIFKSLSRYLPAVIRSDDSDKISSDLDSAMKCLEDGLLDEAKNSLSQLLKTNPNNAAVNLHMGRTLAIMGKLDDAVPYLTKASSLDHDNLEAIFALANIDQLKNNHQAAVEKFEDLLNRGLNSTTLYYNLGLALRDTGEVQAAIDYFSKALKQQPEDENTRFSLAETLLSDGRQNDAMSEINYLLERSPDSVKYRCFKGYVLLANDELDSAFSIFEALIEAGNESPEILNGYAGGILKSKNSNLYIKAVKMLKQAIALDPSYLKARMNLGMCYSLLLQHKMALSEYEYVVEQDPKNADVYFWLGYTYTSLLEYDDAVDAYNMAIYYKPDKQSYHIALARLYIKFENYGEARKVLDALNIDESKDPAAIYFAYAFANHQQGLLPEAEKDYKTALSYKNDDEDIVDAMVHLLREQGRLDESMEHLKHTQEIHPNSERLNRNYCGLLSDMGQIENSEQCFLTHISKFPQDYTAQWNYALLALQLGHFDNAWENYELRKVAGVVSDRGFSFEEWQGQDLKGKTIFIYAEQGLGDEIMFASCIPDLQHMGAEVIVECDPRLAPIFERSFLDARIYGKERNPDKKSDWLGTLGHVDYQCAIGSLPQFFRNGSDKFPVYESGYLSADSAKVEACRARLSELPGRYSIGISWRGGLQRERKSLRSIDLELWLEIFDIPDCNFISLQYTDCEEEIAALEKNHGIRVYHWQDVIDDYDQTAAMVCALDHVVSVQTSLIHLCGALGEPVDVLIPFRPEWRYMHKVERLPWYQSVRLWRQKERDAWQPVLSRVTEHVKKVLPNAK